MKVIVESNCRAVFGVDSCVTIGIASVALLIAQLATQQHVLLQVTLNTHYWTSCSAVLRHRWPVGSINM